MKWYEWDSFNQNGLFWAASFLPTGIPTGPSFFGVLNTRSARSEIWHVHIYFQGRGGDHWSGWVETKHV